MKKSLQQLADERLALEYRQPVKTLDDACKEIGWNKDDDPLLCCGNQVSIRSLWGGITSAECKTCHRFLWDVTAPEIAKTGSAMLFVDQDQYAVDDAARWISGQLRDG